MASLLLSDTHYSLLRDVCFFGLDLCHMHLAAAIAFFSGLKIICSERTLVTVDKHQYRASEQSVYLRGGIRRTENANIGNY